nr:MAG TPA: hypothetical protein [Caudoviricetes sp.]
MKLFFEVLQDNWETRIGYRIIISIMIISLLVKMCLFIYGLIIYIYYCFAC